MKTRSPGWAPIQQDRCPPKERTLNADAHRGRATGGRREESVRRPRPPGPQDGGRWADTVPGAGRGGFVPAALGMQWFCQVGWLLAVTREERGSGKMGTHTPWLWGPIWGSTLLRRPSRFRAASGERCARSPGGTESPLTPSRCLSSGGGKPRPSPGSLFCRIFQSPAPSCLGRI